MTCVTKAISLAGMIELGRLRTRLAGLGLGFSSWDSSGHIAGALQGGCDFCRAVAASGTACCTWAGELAAKVLSRGELAEGKAPIGCWMLSLPVYQRRRLLGAVVACYPTRQMAQADVLDSLCNRLGMDREITRSIAGDCCRHGMEEAGDFKRIVAWLMEQEQTMEVANNEIATLSANLANTYEELSLVYRISGTMKLNAQAHEFLQNICNELTDEMNITGAIAMAYPHRSLAQQDQILMAGDVRLNEAEVQAFAEQIISPRLASSGRACVDNNFQNPHPRLDQAVRNYIAAPLSADNTPMGMLIGLNKRKGDFDSIELKLINAIANEASVFLANNRLYADINDLLMGVLHALTSSVDAKDPYTCGHSQRVAMISRRLAEKYGYPAQKVERVYLMGLLHDIGKIGVPESVLCKPGKLTDEEFECIKRHPAIGAKILKGIRQLEDVVEGILTHHERPDGRGYPCQLKGDQLPVEGLIIGLADCFDAMTSSRTYRKALPLEAVIAEIKKHSGSQFHPALVDLLLAMDLEGFLKELRQLTNTPLGEVGAVGPVVAALPAVEAAP